MDRVKIKLDKKFNPFEHQELWDILIILDCCRYKEFAELNDIKGKLQKRISFSTDTGAWIDSTVGMDLKNVIYISGNPIIRDEHFDNINAKNPFLKIVPVWDFGWSNKLKTTPPEPVTMEAKKMNLLLPKRKMVVHYMQPHHPFIGNYDLKEDGYKAVIETARGGVCDEPFDTIYSLLQKGVYTYGQGIKAYKDNLRLVLGALKPLLKLPGKIIITSDHGDYLGEDGKYGHGRDSDLPLLLKVPWFEVAKQ